MDVATFTLTEAERALLPTDEEVEHYAEHGWYLTRKLLTDDEAHAKILAMVRSTNALLDRMTKGEGAGARLLRDPQLYESLNGSLRELSSFLQDFREHPKKYLRVEIF